MKFTQAILYLCCSGFLSACVMSCNIINPTEGIPAYLQVDTFSFTVQPGQGTANTKITDVWVYDENNLLGAYEMPKTFPVLDSGLTKIILSAGIEDDGIAETRIEYPFYFPDTVTLNLKPGVITPVKPHFTYRPGTKFWFDEDFEAGNIFIKVDGDTTMVRSTDFANVFEGSASGYIYLDHDHEYYQGRTSASYALPKGQPAYLELNYKCDQPFQIGLFATVSAIDYFYYKWTINSKGTWNKIYLDMGSDVASLGADSYQILVKAVFDSTRTDSHIYLDNVKLVSF